MLTKRDLQNLRKSLPKGYRQKIAQKVKCVPEYVDMVLRGDRKNLRIVEIALRMVKEHNEKINQLNKDMGSI